MCSLPLLHRICRESYSEPRAVYEVLKRRGMTLVTVTDHDSIDAAESLRSHPDFFLSEEVTCTMPSGTEAHVGVYDINERQHAEIQRRRNDVPSLAAYLHEQELFFSINHVFSALTGARHVSDFHWFEEAVPAVETLNGAMPQLHNIWAARFAVANRKAPVGGSDAHALFSLGSAFTEVPGARNKEEFVAGLRSRRARVCGESGSYLRLTRAVLCAGGGMIRERWATLWLAPLAVLVPLVTLAYHGLERRFALQWIHRVASDRAIRAERVSRHPRKLTGGAPA